jgi:hypothetical protein
MTVYAYAVQDYDAMGCGDDAVHETTTSDRLFVLRLLKVT